MFIWNSVTSEEGCGFLTQFTHIYSSNLELKKEVGNLSYQKKLKMILC